MDPYRFMENPNLLDEAAANHQLLGEANLRLLGTSNLHLLGEAAESIQKSDEAKAKFAKFMLDLNDFICANPHLSGVKVVRSRGFELLLQNKSAEAEAEFTPLVDYLKAYFKTVAAIYWGRAKARLDQAKYDGCVEDSKKAIELDGSVWNPYLYMGIAYFHQKRYDEAKSVLLMGVDLATNNRSDFDNIISKVDEALVVGNAGSVLAGNGDPEHANLVDPEQYNHLYAKTLMPSDINKALVIYSKDGQVMFDEAVDRGVVDAHTNTFPIHLINGAGGETTETVMYRADNRYRVNWKGFLALNPELIVGQEVNFSKKWVQVLGVNTLILKVVPV